MDANTKQPRKFWAVLFANGGGTLVDGISRDEAEVDAAKWFHTELIYLTETDPPPPEKSPAEVAWEKLYETFPKQRKFDGIPVAEREAFMAGYEAGRAAK